MQDIVPDDNHTQPNPELQDDPDNADDGNLIFSLKLGILQSLLIQGSHLSENIRVPIFNLSEWFFA